jgi:transposase-like protein
METPKTLQEAIQHFSDFEICRQFMVSVRWPNGAVRCPACDSDKVTYLKNARLYKCYGDHAKPKFSLKVGTIFEDSPIALEKWLAAVWLIVNCKNGVSSHEIHRALGVTQKSAWFMLHRIRLAMRSGSIAKLGGEGSEVEVDETFVGGKLRNMHLGKQVRYRALTDGAKFGGPTGKAVVVGILDRTARKIRASVVPDVSRLTLQNAVLQNVTHGTNVYTDQAPAYQRLNKTYLHEVVNHAETYVRGRVHTNGLENFWSLLKRNLSGTYVCVEPFHLERYVDEQAFRYNNRATKDNPLNDGDRFQLAMSQIVGKRLTYAELTGKNPVRPPS